MSEVGKKIVLEDSWQQKLPDDEYADKIVDVIAEISDDEFLHLYESTGEDPYQAGRPLINMNRDEAARLVEWLFDNDFIQITAVYVEKGL